MKNAKTMTVSGKPFKIDNDIKSNVKNLCEIYLMEERRKNQTFSQQEQVR